MKKYYVYAHYRKSDGVLFYIGKGQRDRATSKRRNVHWKRIVAKHGYFVKYISKNMTEACALSLERGLIFIHRNKLCNMTDGGEGTSGLRNSISEATKLKIGQANRKPKPEGFGDAVRERLAGKPQPKFRNEKRSKTMKGRHAGEFNPMHGRIGASAPKYDSKSYTLRHPTHGTHIGTTYDIERAFGYRNGALRRVARGLRNSTFGWVLA